MSELIKRLRDYQIGDVADYVERHPEICDEAAARIAELEAEYEKLDNDYEGSKEASKEVRSRLIARLDQCNQLNDRIAELEAAVTDCHAGHTAIERGYLARIAELEAENANLRLK